MAYREMVRADEARTTGVDTIAALKALPAGYQQGQIQVRGYYSSGDGGAGLFYWDAASTATDDGFMAIQPNSAPATGRWRRLL